MTAQEITDQLQTMAFRGDFASHSGELTESWVSAGVGLEAVEPILRFIEAHPDIDYGTPGPLVHFMERFYGSGYEAKLVESVERKPTWLTAWLLNRLINGTKVPGERKRLIETMERARENPSADRQATQHLAHFLERLSGRSFPR